MTLRQALARARLRARRQLLHHRNMLAMQAMVERYRKHNDKLERKHSS